MIRALNTVPTQSVGVNTNRREYTDTLAKLDRIVIDWRHLQESIWCDLHSELAFPYRSCEMELNCETAVGHKL